MKMPKFLQSLGSASARILHRMRMGPATAPMTREQLAAALFFDSYPDWRELEDAIASGDDDRIRRAAGVVAENANNDLEIAKVLTKIARRASWWVLWETCWPWRGKR